MPIRPSYTYWQRQYPDSAGLCATCIDPTHPSRLARFSEALR